MQIIKEHLLISDYVWNADSMINPLADGPTRKRFDRFNGNCMLHMLNLFNCFIDPLTIAQAQKIECLIQNELPLETKSEVSVLQWLKEKRPDIFSMTAVG